jgi:tetratricopeptide (TPR) repeat protein
VKVSEKEFIDILITRDQLEISLHNHHPTSGQLISIDETDQRLHKLGREALNRRWFDLESWRHIYCKKPSEKLSRKSSEKPSEQPPEKPSVGWWWRLDRARFEQYGWNQITLRNLFYTLAALILLYLSLGAIVSTANRVANVLINLLARSQASNVGLDFLTVITFAVQIAVGGPLSLSFAKRLTKAINHTAQRHPSQGRLRRVIMLFIPVTVTFSATVLFLVFVYTLGYLAAPEIGRQLAETAQNNRQSLTDREGVLSLVQLLNPDTNYSNDLTRLGIGYEELGDYDHAEQVYEQALSAQPSLLVTNYLMANLYADIHTSDSDSQYAGLMALNRAFAVIDAYRADPSLLPSLGLLDADYATQIEYLIIVTHAKIYNNLQEYGLAIAELASAEKIAENNDALFIRVDNKPTRQSGEPPHRSRVRVTELYYLHATVCHARWLQTHTQTYQTCEAQYWSLVLSLADSRIGLEAIWNAQANRGIDAIRAAVSAQN